MAHPLTRWEKAVWIASWLAPLAVWGAFIVMGLVIAWPQLRGNAREAAWLIGGVVLAGLVAHAMVWHHGTTAEHCVAPATGPALLTAAGRQSTPVLATFDAELRRVDHLPDRPEMTVSARVSTDARMRS